MQDASYYIGLELDGLVSHSQRAFIKKHSIQDNFLHVQNVVKAAHTKKSMMSLKLDITKAFDSVNWSYLISILCSFGFGKRWREFVSILLKTSSLRILLNGSSGNPSLHQRRAETWGSPVRNTFRIGHGTSAETSGLGICPVSA